MLKKIENNYIFINPNIALGALKNKCEQEYICYLILQKLNKYNNSSGIVNKQYAFKILNFSERSLNRIFNKMELLGFVKINKNNIYLTSIKKMFDLLFVDYYTNYFFIINYNQLLTKINIFNAKEVLLTSILCSNNLPKSYKHIQELTNLSTSSIKRLTVNLVNKTMSYKIVKDNLSYNEAELLKDKIKFSFIKKNKKLYSICAPIGYIFEPSMNKIIKNKYEHKIVKQIRHERLYINNVF